ncbi:MAG: PKD domain-containing protein [Candidatus Aminicenantes bacterium]|nr:PKD domain-containing protein [Candidatus Aminicenantes bacterium]
MKNKKFICVVICILAVLAINSYAETKKLKEVGRFTLVRIKGDVPTSEIMKILLDKYTGDIKYGFDTAGYSDLFIPFIEQIRSGSFQEKSMAVGDKFMWMLFRSKDKVKVVNDLEWAGQAPLPVYSFVVNHNNKNYEFVMPKPCGNISLIGIEEVIPVILDAVCSMAVTPVKMNINDAVTVDMSGSQHAKSMSVDVFNASGTKVASKLLAPDSPSWQMRLSEPGEYVFKAGALNLEDKPSSNPCETKAYVNFPPVCNIWTSCLPCEDYVGRPITLDASNSTDQDGEVVKADFEITDDSGNIIDTLTDSTAPFTWEKIFDEPGIYSISAVVTDDFGAMSKPCKLDIEVTQKNSFFFVEAGPLFARGSHAYYAAAGIGLSLYIVPDVLDFLVSAGPAISLNKAPWKSFLMAKALLNIHAGKAFFGAGAGFTTKVKEERTADIDLIANIGYDVFDNFKSKGAVFFEARGPVGEDKSFKRHHKYFLGFRLYF